MGRRLNRGRVALAVMTSALGTLLAIGCSELVGIEEAVLEATGGAGGATSASTGGTTSTASTGTGQVVGECVEVGDCPDALDPECQQVACVDAACLVTDEASGHESQSQVAGDCKMFVCDGAGQMVEVPAFDPDDDGKQCTVDTCTDGAPVRTLQPAGHPCNDGEGSVCDGAGECVECLAAGDCPGEICQQSHCIPATCADGVQNGDETALDCGGQCNRCPDGLGCDVDADCQSKVCEAGVCKAPNCTDQTHNGAETDVDCGGFCPPCGTGQSCVADSDCQSEVCTGAICQAASCNDATENGAETDTDCGGPQCPDCADGKGCSVATDCAGGVCASATCCTPASQAVVCAGKCGNVTNNCGQTIACGGCAAPMTCQQNVCSCTPEAAAVTCAGTCGTVNNNCGQPVACAPCDAGTTTSSSTGGGDAGTCADGIENGDETDVDCGGACPPCDACQGCSLDGDCASGLSCAASVCGPCGMDAGTD
jgi:hypothetical protein